MVLEATGVVLRRLSCGALALLERHKLQLSAEEVLRNQRKTQVLFFQKLRNVGVIVSPQKNFEDRCRK